MAAADALADAGVLRPEPSVEFSGTVAVRLHGGVAVLPWRDQYLAAIAAGLAAQPAVDGLPAGAFSQVVVHLQKGRAATTADLAAGWQLLPMGGRLLICGDNDLGIASFAKRIGEELGQAGETVANRGHGRIVRFERTAHAGPQPPLPGRVPLLPESDEAAGAELQVDAGVFSGDGLDDGTALLLSCLPLMPPPERIIDLGCGAGHLAIAGLVRWPRSQADLADGDHRAVLCARANLARLGLAERAQVQWWDAREPLTIAEGDLGLLNPPFHTGTGVDLAPARAMFRSLHGALRRGCRALVVANRTLPYEQELAALGEVRTVRQDSGFKVLELRRG